MLISGEASVSVGGSAEEEAAFIQEAGETWVSRRLEQSSPTREDGLCLSSAVEATYPNQWFIMEMGLL